jgi:hypothetical protein
MIKMKEVYTLIKKDVPEVTGRHIVSDARVGGIKLVYKRVSYPIKYYTISKFTFTIPLVLYRKRSGGIGLNITKSMVVYLRPYKKNWTTSRNRLPHNLWGKKEHPLTNIWVELLCDYEDIMKSMPIIKTRIDDQLIIKFLRQVDEKFTIIK